MDSDDNSIDISDESDKERYQKQVKDKAEQDKVIAIMARKKSAVVNASVVEVVKEKKREHRKESDDDCESSPIVRSLANSSVNEKSPVLNTEYKSPTASTFDIAGLKELENEKSSNNAGGNFSFEQAFKI